MNSDAEESRPPLFQLPSWKILTPILVTVLVGLVSIALSLDAGPFALVRTELVTFWGSFYIGIVGAGVYLALLIMTEKNINILTNPVIPQNSVMAFLFLVSGGFVAAVTQTSAGTLTSQVVHTVFMLGFGWQGAISGIAGSGTRLSLADKVSESKTEIAEKDDTIEDKDETLQASDLALRAANQTIEKLKEQLARATGEVGGD